jgi:hypothetical protein
MSAPRQLRVVIGFGNAAFGSSVGERDEETARILRELADFIERTTLTGRKNLWDINGNVIGYATLE